MMTYSHVSWRRVLCLFLQSRRFAISILALLASGMAIWLLIVKGIVDAEMHGFQVVVPLLPALVLGISISGPFGDTEQTGSLPVWRLRLVHMSALLMLAVVVLTLLAILEPELGRALLLRNLAGYTGMAWLGSQILGPSFTPIFVWVLPIAYVMMIMAVDSSRWWAWARQSTTVDSATLIAASLLAIGLLLVVTKPNPKLANDGVSA